MRRGLLLLALLALAGCESLAYVTQAAAGQARLVAARRPLAAVAADPATPAALRERLHTIGRLRTFAREELAMPRSKGFDNWVALGRDHVVWNVVAAPEFSLAPRRWCFPVAGCVSYRGYFRRADAERYAAGLARRGADTTVYGVAAYSTLGWFRDPVLDSWALRGESAVAALMFHEFAHQRLYVPGDTAFSEAYARVVEQEGVRRWLERSGDARALADYRARIRADARFTALLQARARALDALYASGLAPAAMRAAKAAAFATLREDYARLVADWPARLRPDAWMQAPLNNARLASVGNYEERVPALVALLAACGNRLERFHAAAAALAARPAAARNARLDALAHGAAEGC